MTRAFTTGTAPASKKTNAGFVPYLLSVSCCRSRSTEPAFRRSNAKSTLDPVRHYALSLPEGSGTPPATLVCAAGNAAKQNGPEPSIRGFGPITENQGTNLPGEPLDVDCEERDAPPVRPPDHIATDQGWLFLAVVIDLFLRQVIGWSLRADTTRDIVIDALRIAWFKRHPSKQAGLILHSDTGSQYASKDYRDALIEYGTTALMSCRGNCWDNACSETLFRSLKGERLHGQRLKTRRQAMDKVVAWMLWYNRARLHSTLAYLSPMQFEENGLANPPRQASA